MLGDKTKNTTLDPIFLRQMIKEMDEDVATRFIASALSLKTDNIRAAFQVACQEMSIRSAERKKKAKGLPADEKALIENELGVSSKNILNSLEALLNVSEYEYEVEPVIIDPDDEEEEDK
jgi:hypothetical protein